MDENKKDYMLPHEVAHYLRVDRKTITRWANEGKLKSFRTLGGHYRFDRQYILALADSSGDDAA